MKVFVLIEKHFYPDVDRGNEIRGIYASRDYPLCLIGGGSRATIDT